MTDSKSLITPFAEQIAARQYFHKDNEGNPVEDYTGMLRRVAKHVARAEAIDAYKKDNGRYPEWYISFEGRKKNLLDLEELDKWISKEGYTSKVKYWEDKFYSVMIAQRFSPGGRILAGAGSAYGQMLNCFVLGTNGRYISAAKDDADSIDGIYELSYKLAKVTKTGGGCGISLNFMRESGAYVEGSGGRSSGPVSFLRLNYNTTLRVIKLEGVRRGAGMATMKVSHPDVLDFITAKDLDRELTEGKIEAFNISLLITDAFMANVEADEPHYFISVISGKPVAPTPIPGKYHLPGQTPTSVSGNPNDPATSKEIPLRDDNGIPARWLWDEIVEHAWQTGDPGVVFVDRINQYWPFRQVLGEILATNPCWTGDTKVWTSQGPRTFRELASTGEDVEVLTQVDGELVFRTMRNPRMTFSSADLVEVVLDTGDTLRCTPNHNLILRDGRKVQAQDLKSGDSLTSVYRYKANSKGYMRITNGEEAPLEHHVVMSAALGRRPEHPAEHVHHIDGVVDNNLPGNLTIMDGSEHNRMHKVISVRPLEYQEPVYNGTVDESHTYFVFAGENDAILSANCGEQPLWAGESCCLGSIALDRYVKEGHDGKPTVSWTELHEDVSTTIRFLDNVQTMNVHPIEDTQEWSDRLRRVGLGVMGDAVMMMKMGYGYASPEAMTLRKDLAEYIRDASIDASVKLGDEKGVFPLSSKVDHVPSLNRRNVHTLSIAPTGTISMVADTSSGIEPVFALAMQRAVGGEYKFRLDPHFEKYLREYRPDINLDDETLFVQAEVVTATDAKGNTVTKKHAVPEVIRDIMRNRGSIHGLTQYFSDSEQALFQTAHDVTPDDHVRVQSIWQLGMDSDEMAMASISKTVNMPNEATPEDVKRTYIQGWRQGLKGITMYRDGSRDGQVLRTDLKEEKKTEKPITPSPTEVVKVPTSQILAHRPRRTKGEMIKAEFRDATGRERKVYVYVGLDEDGIPVEVFITDEDGGHDVHPYAAALGKVISMALKYGAPPGKLADKLIKMEGGSVSFSGAVYQSVPAMVGKLLNEAVDSAMVSLYGVDEDSDEYQEVRDKLVPGKCTGQCNMVSQSGCKVCTVCGFSVCM